MVSVMICGRERRATHLILNCFLKDAEDVVGVARGLRSYIGM